MQEVSFLATLHGLDNYNINNQCTLRAIHHTVILDLNSYRRYLASHFGFLWISPEFNREKIVIQRI